MNKYNVNIYSCGLLTFLHLFHFPRHLQREIENQTAQANRFQQQMRRLDEDIKQNEGLLRRAHMEQKNTKVNQTLPLSDPRSI